MVLGGGDDSIRIRQGRRHGLFAQHVLAGADRVDDDRGMGSRRRANADRVDILASQKIGVVRVGSLKPESLLGFLRPLRVDFRHGDQPRQVRQRPIGQRVAFDDLSGADDPDAQRMGIHEFVVLFE